MAKWDKQNRPIEFILAGTPGEPTVAEGAGGKARAGLVRKMSDALRYGYEFMEIDLWRESEIYEPRLAERIKLIKMANPNFEVGLHFSLQIDLTVAANPHWDKSHDMMTTFTQAAAEMFNAKFILIHSCGSPAPEFGEIKTRQGISGYLVDFEGKNIAKFIESEHQRFKEGKTEFDLKDWVLGTFVKEIGFPRTVPDATTLTFMEKYDSYEKAKIEFNKLKEIVKDAGVKKIEEEIEEIESEQVSLYKELEKVEEEKNYLKVKNISDKLTSLSNRSDGLRALISRRDDYLLRYGEELKPKEYTTIERVGYHYINENIKDKFDFWKNQGAEGEERMAYQIIAKWMFENKDPLWNAIVGDEDPDKIINTWKNKGENKEQVKKLVAAVAAKYLIGHLQQKMKRTEQVDISEEEQKKFSKWMFENPEKKEGEKTIYDYAKNQGMHIYIETANSIENAEGEMRLMNVKDHIEIIKYMNALPEFRGENISYTLDFEHLVSNFLNPSLQIKDLADEDGKYIAMVHINPPRAYEGSHAILRKVSMDMLTIYKWLWALYKKGMKNAYFIWEMGSDQGTYESAVAFRTLKKFLLKNVSPKDLPQEFFGIDKDLEAAQKLATQEHALDPIKGLLMVPEEEHGMLSKAAVEKGKGAEWKKERYK